MDNVKKFQESITKELIITKDRVRNLIGSANWGEEGRYKEAILIKIIKQYLPSNLEIGTGFIVANIDSFYGSGGSISNQLDIIIYEGKTPVVFKEGDFIIVTESSVKAVIEVKSKVVNYAARASYAMNNILQKLSELKQFQSFTTRNNKKFIGLFSYEYDQNYNLENVNDALIENNGFVNHISLGKDILVKYWDDTNGLYPPINSNRCYNIYEIKNLSFSYFISNLLHIITDHDISERSWFSFPIQGTKEIFRKKTTELPDN